MAASSTLELVEKLKAQLAESREDLFRKDRLQLPESGEVRVPKDASTLLAGSDTGDETALSDLRSDTFPLPARERHNIQDEMLSIREEFRHHSNELTTKMHNLASNTRQLSQQLLREREDRLAFQQEVCQRLEGLTKPVQNEALHPKTPSTLLESSVVALREDLEHLSGQFVLLQDELKASFESMAMQLGAVVSWVHEKVEMQPFMKDGMCLSPIMEDRGDESPQPSVACAPKDVPEVPGNSAAFLPAEALPSDGRMFQVLRNIADEMPAIVKQMAEKTQVLVTRVEAEHAERLAHEAHVAEALNSLQHKVNDALGARGEEHTSIMATVRPGSGRVAAPGGAAGTAPVLLNSFQVRRRLNGCHVKAAPDLNFEVQSGCVPTATWPRMSEKSMAQAP